MANRPIITGCQRSGTTLLNLILDSHPEVHGIDEVDFRIERVNEYLTHRNYHPFISLKLPISAHAVEWINHLPEVKVLWCLRDPRSVVSSMVNLNMGTSDGENIPWPFHEATENDLINCSKTLASARVTGLDELLDVYENIRKTPVISRNREQLVLTAALCWRLKSELLLLHRRMKTPLHLVIYERLVSDPQTEITALLQALELSWHDSLLQHHTLHGGFSVGQTKNTRPIDSRSIDQWKNHLNERDVSIIAKVCGKLANVLEVSF